MEEREDLLNKLKEEERQREIESTPSYRINAMIGGLIVLGIGLAVLFIVLLTTL
jgi:hypothetical protein